MRIVAGQWRGRKLMTPKGNDVRPTSDRVREAWMSIVSPWIAGARVLDLFAGTGALGIEALSRGADHADFVEKSDTGGAHITANLQLVGAGSAAEVHRADALKFVAELAPHAYDLAFADPPYDQGLAAQIAELWLRCPFADILGVEHRSFEKLPPGETVVAMAAHRSPSIAATRLHREPLPNKRTAIYAGSFDPITRGHDDLIRRSLEFVDNIVVAVANNSTKIPLFTIAERVTLLQQVLGDDPRIDIRSFEGLLVDFAKTVNASLLIRGLRAVSDFEYEFQMALMNRHLSEKLETVFMVPSLDTTYISASIVREVARLGGDVTGLVHPAVEVALKKRLAK